MTWEIGDRSVMSGEREGLERTAERETNMVTPFEAVFWVNYDVT